MLETVTREKYVFGPYEADFHEHELRKFGTRIKIQSKPFAVLELLLKNHGQVVSRERLQEALWPDQNVFVDFDKSLRTAVNKLREVLCDTAEEHRYIETVPRHGYRFAANVQIVRDLRPLSVPLPSEPPIPVRVRDIKKFWIFGTAIALASVVIAYFLWPMSQAKPQAGQPIVLADFENFTGEQAFNGPFRQSLAFELKQAHLNLLSDARISEMLELMARPKDSPVIGNIANEVCIRSGSVATVEGSVASLGSQYVLVLKANNCSNGELLAQEQVTTDRKEKVLGALESAAVRLRQKLGESIQSSQRIDAPPELVTTTSLEALQAYDLGYRVLLINNNSHPALPFFQRAISLDPNFAMAYARLGRCYDSEDQYGLALDNFKKAFQLRDHASKREQFYIDSYYENVVTGDLEAAARRFELWVKTNPSDGAPHAALANIYRNMGQYDRALAEFKIAVDLDPNGVNYGNLASILVGLRSFDQARALATTAKSRGLDSPEIHLMLAWAAWAEGKPEERESLLSSVRKDPLVEQWAFEDDTSIAAYTGQFAKARLLIYSTEDGYHRIGRADAFPIHQVDLAIGEALAGEFQYAKTFAENALTQSENRDVRGRAAIALALSGSRNEALRLADELNKQYPNASTVQRNYLPAIRASIALHDQHPEDAIRDLEPALPYELGDLGYPLLPLYLRGEAYLAMNDRVRSIEASTKLASFCPYYGKIPCALGRLQFARATAMSGNNAKAIGAYQSFFSLWKDADQNTPILKAAQSEYAKLR
jgi:DNA-binding winged helix-turn-helix (wHTH) protein/tetratricopeptide (TPR) repeat protein